MKKIKTLSVIAMRPSADLDVQQQHQGPIQADGRATHRREEQIVHYNQCNTEQG